MSTRKHAERIAVEDTVFEPEVQKTVKTIETIPQTTTMLAIVEEGTPLKEEASMLKFETYFTVRPAIDSRMLHLARFEDEFIKKIMFVSNDHVLI